jgi:hypothetical protein
MISTLNLSNRNAIQKSVPPRFGSVAASISTASTPIIKDSFQSSAKLLPKLNLPIFHTPEKRADYVLSQLKDIDSKGAVAQSIRHYIQQMDNLAKRSKDLQEQLLAKVQNEAKEMNVNSLSEALGTLTKGDTANQPLTEKQKQAIQDRIEHATKSQTEIGKATAQLLQQTLELSKKLTPADMIRLQQALSTSHAGAFLTDKEMAAYTLSHLPKQSSPEEQAKLEKTVHHYFDQGTVLLQELMAIEHSPAPKSQSNMPTMYDVIDSVVSEPKKNQEQQKILANFQEKTNKLEADTLAALPKDAQKVWAHAKDQMRPDSVEEQAQFIMNRMPDLGSAEKNDALHRDIQKFLKTSYQFGLKTLPELARYGQRDPKLQDEKALALLSQKAQEEEKTLMKSRLQLDKTTNNAFWQAQQVLEVIIKDKLQAKAVAAFSAN